MGDIQERLEFAGKAIESAISEQAAFRTSMISFKDQQLETNKQTAETLISMQKQLAKILELLTKDEDK